MDRDPRTEVVQRLNKLILSSAGEGIYGLDCEGLTTFVNPAAAKMLGWTAEELTGQPMHALLHHTRPDGSPFPRHECPIYAAFKDGQVRSVDDEVFWRKDGSSFPVEYTSTPIREHGELCGAVVVFRNLTEIQRTQEELRRALAEVEALKTRLQAENVYLQEEIRTQHGFEEIIGQSAAIRHVLENVATVATTDANVVVVGETGTGKELISRAVHNLSSRKDKTLIKVNCASIPHELFESEFFGHVKGAFTGALRHRAGRFELADGGTLFLDEVGEIPLAMQSKLLRVLQEGQFERIGDERTRQVDVRIIAATNRDLKREAEEGRFRQDLYYRLNVFPIAVPPLRERREDIPLLAAHFLEQVARELKRPGPRLTQANIDQLQGYDWPGNIRELRNVIERAVIVARAGELRFDLPTSGATQPTATQPPSPALGQPGQAVISDAEMRDQERRNLIAALESTGWKVYGPEGAAALLGIKPSTLASRIKKMAIVRPA
ncbi:MAG: sigma 54-interacting transcriptional regulator [Acidobacteriota bacterium]